MRIVTAVLAAVLSVACGAVEAAPRKKASPVVTNPDWLSRPTGEDVARHYPELPRMLAMEGRAAITCGLDDLGQMQDCKVVSEAPASLGFGEAALAMSRSFRMRPMTRDGKPVTGGEVTIPISFRLPAPPQPQPGAESARPPAPEAAKVIAHQVAAELRLDERARDSIEAEARKLEARQLPYATITQQTLAAEALRQAMDRHAKAFEAPVASALADRFNVVELQRVLAFLRGPGGRAMTRVDEDDLERAQREYFRVASLRAQAAFCGRWLCKLDVRTMSLAADISGPNPKVTIPLPEWQERPSPGQVRVAAPRLAVLLGLPGLARLNCKVTALGGLDACDVADEQPLNLGYGEAALRLAPLYRVSRRLLVQGAASETTSVLVVFPARPVTPEVIPPKAESMRSVDLAIRVLAAAGNGESTRASWRAFTDQTVEDAPGLSDDARAAMREILREVQQPASVASLAVSAAQMAASMTEAELLAQAVFFESPTGRKWAASQQQIGEAIAEAFVQTSELVLRDARTAFCASQGCLEAAVKQKP